MLRPYLAISLFALAVLAVACGGGGGSTSVVPGTSAPHATQYGGAALTLKIPAQSRSGSIKRPAYVSPNTLSAQVYAYSLASPSVSPSPQTFPVATPSPCTQNPDGSKTCTFDVQAPIGEDQFVIKTYSVLSPGPSDTPLATFQTGAIDVVPGTTPPPINFTLSGVVASVGLAVQSPEPSIASQSTQIWTVGSPLPAQTLAITPRDASGSAILTDSFDSPITISLSPSNGGVSLALSTSQCSPASTISGAVVRITCAKDLGNVTYAYDGTIGRNGSKNVVDHFTFSAQPQPQNTATPTPAVFELGGTMFTQALPAAGLTYPSTVQFARRPDGTFNYLVNGYSVPSSLGSFDPSNPSAANAVALQFSAGQGALAITSSGDIWVGPNPGNSVDCFTSVSGSASNVFSLPNGIAATAMATDANNDVWYYGEDPSFASWTGYFTTSPGCGNGSPLQNPAQVGQGDAPQAAVVAPNSGGPPGVYLLSSSANIYYANTSMAGGVITKPYTSPPGFFYGQGLATDAAGDLYATLPQASAPPSVIGQVPAGTSMMNTGALTPNSYPYGLDVYTSAGTTHLAVADGYGLDTIDFSGSIGSSVLQIAPVNVYQSLTAFFDGNGDPWLVYTDPSAGAPSLLHLVRTSVWTVAQTSLSAFSTGGTALLTINETGDSGPFTVTNISAPAVAATEAPWPGIDHVIPLQITPANGSSVTITVTDNHGRSLTRTYPIISVALTARRRNALHPPRIPRKP